MAKTFSIDVEGLTVGKLDELIQHARFAGANDDHAVMVVAEDNLGNPTPPHTVTIAVH
jgi:hypothetical protein